ncbi:hypothetical protein [Absidia glauca]|uniref:BHLH domain-containing protein n=1 Tax=Absidia glauca TaxID=4829 RepID=A0A163IX39_ABSGL|nr:hypothetical protein [Absidia glauca]
MSEMTLSNSSSNHQYDYMVNINPSMVQKVSSPEDMNTSPSVSYDDSTQPYPYQEYAFQPMPLAYPPVYPVTRFDQPPATTYYDPQRLVQPHPNSPDSVSSRSSPPTPPSSTTNSKTIQAPTVITMHPSSSTSTTSSTSSSVTTSMSTPYTNQLLTAQALDTSSSSPSNTTSASSPMINPLVPSTFTNATTARVKETIARANSVPMEFYHTEFLEYSKETYERKMDAKRNKRKRPSQPHQRDKDTPYQPARDAPKQNSNKRVKKEKETVDESDDDVDDEEDEMDKMVNTQGLCNTELRRQIHIQSEQKRRAQIKDGFDELRKHLPGCNNKKMSKAALLTRTVQQLQHLKVMQTELLSEVERLVQENDNLKKFQHGVLQRQAMEKMYNF